MSTAGGPRSGQPSPATQISAGSAVDRDSRRALVFGGGGVLGFAWTVGALRALETEWGIDANAVGLTVGTSAGSMLAALLGCGIPADVIRRHHQGVPAPADPSIAWDYTSDSGGALPPWPGFVPGSPKLFLDAMLHPASFVPAVAFSGLLPRGRGSLDPIRSVISAAVAATGAATDEFTWPAHPRTWIVATDYDNGGRVVFGRDRPGSGSQTGPGPQTGPRPGSQTGPGPQTGSGSQTGSETGSVALGDAVAASCSIPAWFSPVSINGRLYIDGGTVSNASADLVLSAVADGTVDEVFVLAPMASVEPGRSRSRSPMVRLERAVRRAVTRGIQHDAALLRAAGARVVVLTPGPYDLDVMGANLMNPRRRTEVLETSLLTSAAALRELRLNEDIAPRGSAEVEMDVEVDVDTKVGGRARRGHGPGWVGARGAAGPERSAR